MLEGISVVLGLTGKAEMLRRDFVRVVAGSTVAFPLAVPAQPTQAARIGWMSRGNPTANDPAMNAFRQGMGELGYVEGRTFVIERRYAEGKTEVMPEQAAELERAGVDVVVAGPFDALQAAKQSTSRRQDSPDPRPLRPDRQTSMTGTSASATTASSSSGRSPPAARFIDAQLRPSVATP